MLLIIEALLLILAALGQDHSAAAAVEGKISLDMAPDSVDDQYKGCRKNMTDLVETELLKNDLNNLEIFKIAWGKAEKIVKTPKKGLSKTHEIAIYVYSDALVFDKFTSATRRDQWHHKTYKWYSLHFLLTDAIQILKKTQNKCMITYRGSKNTFVYKKQNKEIRFGSFASSSLDPEVAKGFGTKSCFEIYTCEGADVTKYSKLPEEKEVLIPPYEKFKVTAVKTKGQKGAWCETVFELKSSGTRSNQNCALFKKPRPK